MRRLLGTGLPIALTAVLCSQAAAERGIGARPAARGQAYAVRIELPNQPPVVAGQVAGPPSLRVASGSFTYPQDGSVVSVQSVTGRAAGDDGEATAGADLRRISLFGGEITADAVVARSSSRAGAHEASGDFGASGLTNLVVFGEPVTPAPDLRVQLADWGHVFLLRERTIADRPGGPITHRDWVTVLDVWLDGDHAGMPVGTRILVGYADTSVRAVPPAARPAAAATAGRISPPAPQRLLPAPRPGPAPRARITRGLGVPSEQPRPGSNGPSALALLGDGVAPRLTQRGYVFPVHGAAGFGDTFGAPRADTVWHHGVDIFAPLGAPVLAVADGTVFSVGRTPIGGNRLWLRDRYGDEFYYAHLSAYSPLALNGARVAAGDVLGFVGNTGDAENTPYHLHFEIHPASLLFLGYDGVVNPTRYLRAWEHLQDIDFPSGAAWAPTVVATGRAPQPGAILLQATDISTASGLDPASLSAAIAPRSGDGEGLPRRRVPARHERLARPVTP